jgi:(1->4)-alpha-D-glucan 1-alpha-D-glucosylmutase
MKRPSAASSRSCRRRSARERSVRTGLGPTRPTSATWLASSAGQERREAFQQAIRPLAGRLATIGLSNTLAQTLIKFTAPGVPDTYQGCELPDFSLVDPDNRRPVDYARRLSMLKATGAASPKLSITLAALAARRSRRDLFLHGAYVPLRVAGTDRLFAFARRLGETCAIVVVPRCVGSFQGDWRDAAVRLPDGIDPTRFRNGLTGDRMGARAFDDSGMGFWITD